MTPLPNISTGDLKADQRTFTQWCMDCLEDCSQERYKQAGIIEASFNNLRTMNKDKPEAWAKLKELHDADVAKLQAMIAG